MSLLLNEIEPVTNRSIAANHLLVDTWMTRLGPAINVHAAAAEIPHPVSTDRWILSDRKLEYRQCTRHTFTDTVYNAQAGEHKYRSYDRRN